MQLNSFSILSIVLTFPIYPILLICLILLVSILLLTELILSNIIPTIIDTIILSIFPKAHGTYLRSHGVCWTYSQHKIPPKARTNLTVSYTKELRPYYHNDFGLFPSNQLTTNFAPYFLQILRRYTVPTLHPRVHPPLQEHLELDAAQ